MKLYKLTDQNGKTKDNTQWGIGVTHTKKLCGNPQLCSRDVLHAYMDKNLAFLLNPIHAAIGDPQLWECDGEIAVKDFAKCGCFRLTSIRKIKVPQWVESKYDIKIRTVFAILCAESVLPLFTQRYPNDDRPKKAIDAAKIYIKYEAARSAGAAESADLSGVGLWDCFASP